MVFVRASSTTLRPQRANGETASMVTGTAQCFLLNNHHAVSLFGREESGFLPGRTGTDHSDFIVHLRYLS